MYKVYYIVEFMMISERKKDTVGDIVDFTWTRRLHKSVVNNP